MLEEILYIIKLIEYCFGHVLEIRYYVANFRINSGNVHATENRISFTESMQSLLKRISSIITQ